ncbi:MAG: hypothetical protein PUD20_00900 [bacterium]|nr:hypothetical protein [bacterium]
MTNKEKFQKTFDKLHASPEIVTEVLDMMEEQKVVSMKKRFRMPKAAVAAIAMILTLGSGTVAYATDLGGIQEKVKIWFHGVQTEAIFTADNGEYTLSYTDADGNEFEQGGTGEAYDDETGEVRPLTNEELLAQANAPTVSYEEDGSVLVYYKDQVIDVTDQFEDGVCNIQLEIDGKPVDMTIRYQEGYELMMNGEEEAWTYTFEDCEDEIGGFTETGEYILYDAPVEE